VIGSDDPDGHWDTQVPLLMNWVATTIEQLP